MIQGVDYAWPPHPGGAALAAAGKAFACRYLTWPHAPGSSVPAFLTAAEIADLHNNGVAVVAIFEREQDRMLVSGAAGGTADGTSARVEMARLGFPPGSACYVSQDKNAAPAQFPGMHAYFRAFVIAFGTTYRPGFYGEKDVWAYFGSRGLHPLFWQSAAIAWSDGTWEPKATVQQYRNGQTLNGAAVDLDRALVADYGQWAAPQLPETDTEVDVPNYSLGGIRTGFVAVGTPYFTNPGDSAPRSKTTTGRRYLLATVSADGKRVCIDGRYDQAVSATPQMCGWVDASVVTDIQPVTRPYHVDLEVTSSAAPVVTVTQA